MSNELQPRRVALVGLMGSGKTEVAASLADALGCSAHDLDALVEADAARTISEIFAGAGEEAFRDRESKLLELWGAVAPPFVLSTGGGIVVRESNRKILETRFLAVWIRVDPAVALRRVSGGGNRPLLQGTDDPHAVLVRLQRERAPWYDRVARIAVSNEGPDPVEDVSSRILEALRGF